MNYKDRCYAVTVNPGHDTWTTALDAVSKLYDSGVIDYACMAVEESKWVHVQGFITFNESAFVDEDGLPIQPTEHMNGHFTKARSISGARDYCAREGIHVGKKGHFRSFEFGEYVDPAWNQHLRTRKIFEFTQHIVNGADVGDLVYVDPAGVLLIGQANLQELIARRKANLPPQKDAMRRPYYYIGSSQLKNELNDLEKTYDLSVRLAPYYEEE